jgi:DMSO/TMAO reductase YedYZ molybdopterin-dependent catalytic subunit
MLLLTGDVESPARLTFADLSALEAAWQVPDISQIDSKRKGSAVRLAGLLALVRPRATAAYLTLHATADDFHASIPLAAVRDRALVIYCLGDSPLPASLGGPIRFFIPDFAACHTSEVDECANVKFVDHLEFSATPGRDNRPHDAQQHDALHEREGT